jgi:hypothetical protein
MNIRSEFWSAVEKSYSSTTTKKAKSGKVITLSNEPAYYEDVLTMESHSNDIDAEIMYLMTKTKAEKIQKFSLLETDEDIELRRREWRIRNNMFEMATVFTPTAAASSAASSAAGSGGGSIRIDDSDYVVNDYVVRGYVQ